MASDGRPATLSPSFPSTTTISRRRPDSTATSHSDGQRLSPSVDVVKSNVRGLPHSGLSRWILSLCRFLGVTPPISTSESNEREREVTTSLMEELKRQGTFESEEESKTRWVALLVPGGFKPVPFRSIVSGFEVARLGAFMCSGLVATEYMC